MSTIQISLSPDLTKLVEDGFEIEIVRGTSLHLMVKNVPYLNSNLEVLKGTLECPLEIEPDGTTVNPLANHQTWFIGEMPYHSDGTPMTEMVSDQNRQDRGDDIWVDMAFSRKRSGGIQYNDYYEKITTYVKLLSNEAKAIYPECNPKTGKPPIEINKSDVFHFADMATTRTGAGAAASRLKLDKVSIIGLGGTGAYILDLVAKTHVQEINLFDGDIFESHSSFRAPGAASVPDFGKLKVDYYSEVYGKMRKGVIPHREYITAKNIHLLDGTTFAFVAVDSPEARKEIFSGLIQRGIPFLDVGMGVTASTDGKLRGTVRTTTVTAGKTDHIDERVSFATGPVNDVYTSDIQVADLNALNATFAVIRWKKLYNYYQDEIREHHSVYSIGRHALSKDDRA